MVYHGMLAAALSLGLLQSTAPQIEPVSLIFSPKGTPNSLQEDQKITVRKFLDGYCENNVEVVSSVITKGCEIENISDKRHSKLHLYSSADTAVLSHLKRMHDAFDSFSYKIEKVVIGGNQAVYFVSMTMRQKGPYLGIEPKNQYITVKTALFFEFVDSRINKIFEFPDELSLFKQMGYLPL